MKTLRIVLAIVGGAAAVAGCESKSAPPAPAPASAPAAAPTLPADLFLAAAPAEPAGVKAAKDGGKQGDKVVLRGRIGGSVDPFVENRAVFTLMDFGLATCSDDPNDKCTTPWDNCCETAKDILANAATVQVVGADGAPLKAGLSGVSGLKPAAEVFVVGTIAQRDDSGAFVVNATGLFVKTN